MPRLVETHLWLLNLDQVLAICLLSSKVKFEPCVFSWMLFTLYDKQTIDSRENMLGYLFTDIICCERQTVFREHSLRKTVSFEEQIMSKDNYPSIFPPQMEAIVFIIFQFIFALCAVLKIGNIWSCDMFRPIAHEQKYLMAYKLYY